MIELIQIVGGIVIVLAGFDLLSDKNKEDAKKTWYKIGGGFVLLTLGTVLRYISINF